MSEQLKGSAENKLARQLKNAVRLAKDRKMEKERAAEILKHHPDVERLQWKISGLEFDLRMMGPSLIEARRCEKRNWKWFLLALFGGLLGWALLYLLLCWRELSC
jgi:hypothetical protein